MNRTKFWNEEIKRDAKGLQAAPSATTGRESKTIGVEIEFFGCDAHATLRKLALAGLEIYPSINYNHTTMPKWKIVTDASVSGNGTGIGRGLELVSPPLPMDEMNRQLKIALDVLNELGAKVNKTCGVHIHHDIDDLSVNDVKNIFRLYKKHEKAIDGMMPPSRRADYQLTCTTGSYALPLSDADMNVVESADSVEELAHNISTRFKTLNLKSYVRYGTIEFRHHSGTIEFDKIWNWIVITQATVAAAKRMKKVRAFNPRNDFERYNQWTKDLNLWCTEQAAYIMARKNSLKKAEQERQERRGA